MKTFNAVALYSGRPWPCEPFVCRVRLYDIGNTVISALNNLPPQCVAATVVKTGNEAEIERAARKRGIRILWRKPLDAD